MTTKSDKNSALNHIDEIISTIKKETKKFRNPSVTMVALDETRNKPYHVLISCLLSLRTKDNVTIEAFHRLKKLAQTPEEMATLSQKQVEKAIYPVGFYKTKAGRIIQISEELVEKYNSKVPDKIDELLKFNGVGRKTANLVMTQGFGKLGICVDTHVHKISNRLGIVRTKTPEQTEYALRKILPKKYWIDYNDLLVMWGQNVCVPVSPWCSRCQIRKYCPQIGVLRNR